MVRNALVTAVSESKISAVIIEKSECASCTVGCSKKTVEVDLANPKGFSLKPGCVVAVQSQKRYLAMEGFFSLLLPFVSAVCGYCVASSIDSVKDSEGIKAVFVLGFLAAACALVLIFTRLPYVKIYKKAKCDVVEILKESSTVI